MSPTNQDVITKMAHELVALAKRCNLVLTIELEPKQPLAMGHYDMVVDVRPARATAKEAA